MSNCVIEITNNVQVTYRYKVNTNDFDKIKTLNSSTQHYIMDNNQCTRGYCLNGVEVEDLDEEEIAIEKTIKIKVIEKVIEINISFDAKK